MLAADQNIPITNFDELLFLLSYARKIEIQHAGRVPFETILGENSSVLQVEEQIA